jgi:hypothetical protein
MSKLDQLCVQIESMNLDKNITIIFTLNVSFFKNQLLLNIESACITTNES